MEYSFPTITSSTQAVEAIEACKANPALASMVAPLEAHLAKLEAEEIERAKWEGFLIEANTVLGTVPDYQPDWRKLEACQTIAIVTKEIEDTEAEDVLVKLADGSEDWRKPRKLVREVVLGVMPARLPSGGKAEPAKRKKAITVLRIGEDLTAELIGHFRNGEEACNYLGIDTKADSAPRKLQAAGYTLKPYEGEDFTVSEA